MAVDFEVFAE